MNNILKNAGFKSHEINSMYCKYANAAWNSVNRWSNAVKSALSAEKMKAIEEKMNGIAATEAGSSRLHAEQTMKDLSRRFKEARN